MGTSEITIRENRPATLTDMRANPQVYPRLKAYTRQQATGELRKIVFMAVNYRGQAADESYVQYIADSLYDELMEDRMAGAENISIEEIRYVVKRAVLGDSEMFGISVASLYKVIMDYVKGEGHRIDKEVKDSQKQLKTSAVTAFLDAAATQFVSNNKINR